MPENKIRYGLKNVHYAIATIAADNTATYGTPKPFPGAVSLALDPQGENTPFYADDIAYWIGASNTGYSGDLEMALVTDDFEKDVLGALPDNKGVMIEDVNAQAVHFALLFQVAGDAKATRHVLYNCTATRPQAGGQTKGETVEPQTQTTTITATSIHIADLDKDISKAKTTSETDETVYNEWFNSVYQPAALAAAGGQTP